MHLLASREGSYTTKSAVYKRIAHYTFANQYEKKTNIIVLEAQLQPDIQKRIIDSKKVMIRIYSKNLDGVHETLLIYSKSDFTFVKLKGFLMYPQEYKKK